MTRAWTGDEEKLLRCLVNQGYSAGNIELAMSRSRNAIIGRVHRTPGLVLRGKPPGGSVKGRVRAKPVSTTPKPLPPKEKPVVQPALSTTPMQPIAPVIASDIHPVFALRSDQCRWPHGDVGAPDFRFCDATKDGSRSYCPHHCRIAFAGPVRAEISEAQKQMMRLGRLRAGVQ